MPDIQELIANFDDDSDEQRQLIELISRIVEPTFRRALAHWNTPIQELHDLRQEFFKERVGRNWQLLKEFQGSTEASFIAYWRDIGWRFAERLLRNRVRSQRRESEAVAAHVVHDGSGASEAEILARLGEVEPVLTPAERRLLEKLLNLQPGAEAETVPPEAGQDGSRRPPSRHAWLTRIARLRWKIRRLLRGDV